MHFKNPGPIGQGVQYLCDNLNCPAAVRTQLTEEVYHRCLVNSQLDMEIVILAVLSKYTHEMTDG